MSYGWLERGLAFCVLTAGLMYDYRLKVHGECEEIKHNLVEIFATL